MYQVCILPGLEFMAVGNVRLIQTNSAALKKLTV